MCCASLSPSAFAATEGLSQPSPIKPYHPTGDPDHDKKIALTTAKRCCDVLKDLHSGNDAVAIATKYLELSQALSDLGLLKYASKTSGFALETFRAMHTAGPDDFSLSVASVLSLLANISADLNEDKDAVNAANEAVALFQDSNLTPFPNWCTLCSTVPCYSAPLGKRSEELQWHSDSQNSLATRMSHG
ncbi:hypothetical protein EI94DRAFT_217209 [Lactarius quietus]|nr:hypothetical protein EI94DRAFT_217209 [Lactarius quietus]